MDRTELDLEVRDTIARLPRLPFASRLLLPLARFAYNLASRTKVEDGIKVQTVADAGIEMLVFSNPENPSGAGVLWMYAGGFVAGKPEHINALASMIALRTGASVFVPKYRLAPKNPFPAALEDGQAAWNWLLSNCTNYGVAPDRLAVGGNSAGGGLAATLVHWIHDQGSIQPRSQILFYPMLDDRTAADHTHDLVDHFIWNNRANRIAWSAYLAPHLPGANRLPDYAVPARRSNLAGLPKAWIGQCSLDLFADEDAQYAFRLQEAGVDCKVELAKAVPHAFEVICPEAKISQAFVESAIEFLNSSLE